MKDPVCGMSTTAQSPHVAQHQGAVAQGFGGLSDQHLADARKNTPGRPAFLSDLRQ